MSAFGNFPPAQSAAFPDAPQPARGSGFGGLGGIVQSPQFGNVLSALGHSLLTSKNSNPMGGFSTALNSLNQQTLQQQEEERERETWAQAFGQIGMDPQLQELARTNPQAAKTVWEHQQAERKRQRAEAERQAALAADQDYLKLLTGGPTDAAATPPAGSLYQAPSSSASSASGGEVRTNQPRFGTGEFEGLNLSLDPPPGAEVAQVAAPQATGAAAPTGNADNRQALLNQRDFFVRAAAAARTPTQIAQAKLMIDNVDAKINQLKEGNGRTLGLVNAGDGKIYDPNTREWITAPDTGGGSNEFRYGGNSVEAQSLNGLMDSGTLTPAQAQQLGAGKTVTGANGELIFMTPQGVFGRPADGGQAQPMTDMPTSSAPPANDGMIQLTGPKVTLDEKKAMTFADRMSTSGGIIENLDETGTDSWEKAKSSVPLVGNYLVSENYQKLDQARRDFINAQLRRESGAVISPEEFANANQQYFPQPGDGDGVLEQKRRNREIAINGMVRDGGGTYSAPPPSGVTEEDISHTMKLHGLTREQVLDQIRGSK